MRTRRSIGLCPTIVLFFYAFLWFYDCASAWTDTLADPHMAKAKVQGDHRLLIGDIVSVDSVQCQLVLADEHGTHVLTLAQDAKITRNGVEAPMWALKPIEDGLFQDGLVELNSEGVVIRLAALYRSVSSILIDIHWLRDEAAAVVQLRDLNTGSLLISRVHGDIAEDLRPGSEGLAILGWNHQLKHFIPYP